MTEQSNNTQARIFKIGTSTIVEDESMSGLDLDAVKQILQRTYPEVAHATVRERTLEDGSICYDFIARAGRKG
ncbi:MAG: PRTRC system protein C [Aggregatilineales bacterium]